MTAPKPKAKRKPTANRPRPKPKPSGDPTADAFVEHYLTNNHNATAAARAAGLRARDYTSAGYRMLQKTAVRARLAERAQAVAELATMNTANWAAEVRALAFGRIGDLLGPDGQLVPVALLAPHVQAMIAGVKVSRKGVVEYKLAPKAPALEMMARHLGLFERDNAQLKSDIRVSIELVG